MGAPVHLMLGETLRCAMWMHWLHKSHGAGEL
jgi:hypothetical protein